MEVYKCINQINHNGKERSFTYVFVNMAVIIATVAAVIRIGYISKPTRARAGKGERALKRTI